VTSSIVVFEGVIQVKCDLYDKIMIQNQKKKKIWKSKTFYTNGYLNITPPLLSRADARRSTDITYHMSRISLFCGSGIVIDVTK